MSAADKRWQECDAAWRVFVRRQRLMIAAWRAYTKAEKRAERASDRDLEREAAQGDVHEVLREQAKRDRVAAAGNAMRRRGWA